MNLIEWQTAFLALLPGLPKHLKTAKLDVCVDHLPTVTITYLKDVVDGNEIVLSATYEFGENQWSRIAPRGRG